MRRAHERDAATKGKFFFRSNIDYAQSPEGGEAGEIYSPCDNDPQSGLQEMTVLQILEGKVGGLFFFLLLIKLTAFVRFTPTRGHTALMGFVVPSCS